MPLQSSSKTILILAVALLKHDELTHRKSNKSVKLMELILTTVNNPTEIAEDFEKNLFWNLPDDVRDVDIGYKDVQPPYNWSWRDRSISCALATGFIWALLV